LTSPLGDLLLDAVISSLHSREIGEIAKAIDDVISDSTTFSKSSHEMRHQECFALKGGISGALDIARKTYLQTVEDIYLVNFLLLPIELILFYSQ